MNSTSVLKLNSKDTRLPGIPVRALFRNLTRGFIILTLSLSVAFAQEKNADDLRIQWSGMERALELAAENNKTILIDVYAEWCSYCQRMQDEVYPDLEVKKIIREYFIPVRVNVDSKQTLKYLDRSFTQEEFSRALENRSTPTYYFMNEKGEIVGRQPGYMPADVFSPLLEFVGSGAYRTQTYDEFNMN